MSKTAMIHVLACDIVNNVEQWQARLRAYNALGVTSFDVCVRDWEDSKEVLVDTKDTSIEVVRILTKSFEEECGVHKPRVAIHLIPHIEGFENASKAQKAFNHIAKAIFAIPFDLAQATTR